MTAVMWIPERATRLGAAAPQVQLGLVALLQPTREVRVYSRGRQAPPAPQAGMAETPAPAAEWVAMPDMAAMPEQARMEETAVG